MKIKFHHKFEKFYRARIASNKKLVIQTTERIKLFKTNPEDPLLKNHKLVGAKKGLSSFSVTGNIRIVYMELEEDEVIFMDIGSHNQVY